MKCTIKDIKNVPEFASKYKYWVYTKEKGVPWFYGAYNDLDRAVADIKETNGYLINTLERD